MKRLSLCAILLAATASQAQIGAPVQDPNQPRLEFEVATIRPAQPGPPNTFRGIKANADGAGYTSVYVTVKLMISLMYRIPMRQILNAPKWVDDDPYDLAAKADKKYNLDDLHIMYQNLLADRFHLKFHIETKEANAYVLTIDKGGSKMKVNTSPQDYNIPISFSGVGAMKGVRVPMAYFCYNLGQLFQGDERPVVDQTGLTGFYDFNLSWLPDNIPQNFRDTLPQDVLDRPSIFVALKDQLGLKLTAQKGPVQYFVIDHVDRPTEN